MNLFLIAASIAWHGATASMPSKSDLAGIWYGNAASVDDGSPADGLSIRNADGTFVSYFRVCRETIQLPTGFTSTYQTVIETGRWSVANGVETTVTEMVDGTPADASDYYTEQYLVTQSSRDELELVGLRNGWKYTSRRVGEGFHLPPDPCANLHNPAVP